MRSSLLALGILVGFGTVSNATIINALVPTNAYIVQNGLDWAWRAHFPPTLFLILLIMDLTLAFSPNLDGESQLSLNSLWPRLRPRFCFLAGMYLLVCFLLVEPIP